ncbi:unnamed protein product [Prorocentrum cordatum]|uniref:Integrase catalytic domain-containing protein n=1 Tax=Prorocentrum cordatum TaxID=2364126 RepID=A0ABN9TJS7_9DINO|nr:unnamed protein product [Polarella glacialis]
MSAKAPFSASPAPGALSQAAAARSQRAAAQSAAAAIYFVDSATDKVSSATDKVSSATDKVSNTTDKVSSILIEDIFQYPNIDGSRLGGDVPLSKWETILDESCIIPGKVYVYSQFIVKFKIVYSQFIVKFKIVYRHLIVKFKIVYSYLIEKFKIVYGLSLFTRWLEGEYGLHDQDTVGLNINAVGRSYLLLQGCDLSIKKVDDIKLKIDGDLRRYNDIKAIMTRLAKQSLAQNNPEQYEGFWVDSDEEEYWDYYGYYDDYGQWQYYEDDEWWDEEEQYDEQYPPPRTSAADDEAYKGSGKGKKGNPGNCSKCGSRWHRSEDCPAGGKKDTKKGDDNKGNGKSKSDSNNGKGKYRGGKSRGRGKGRGKGYRGRGKGKGKKSKGHYGDDYDEEYYDDDWDWSTTYGSWYATRTKTQNKDALWTFNNRTEVHHGSSWSSLQTVPSYSLDDPESPDMGQGLDFLVREVQNLCYEDQVSQQNNHNVHEVNTSYHSIKGTKRFGLLYDPGASSGIIGTDTVREYQQEILGGAEIESRPTRAQFTGIDGKPTPGIGKAILPLRIPAMKDATFTGDMIGGMGSWCPALMPLPTSIRYRAIMFSAMFDNGDGILVIFPDNRRLGNRATPVYIRLLLTDSRHYIIPTDNQHIREEVDQQYLHGVLLEHLQIFWDFKPSRSGGRSAEFQVDTAPADTSTGAKSSTFSGMSRDTTNPEILKQLDHLSKSIESIKDHIGQPAAHNTHHFLSTKTAFAGHSCGDDKRTQDHQYPTRKTTITRTQNFWKVWGMFKGSGFTGDMIPDGLNPEQQERMQKNYQGIPEKFYTKTKLTVITPRNADSFLKHLQDYKITSVDMQEHFSGSSTLSFWAWKCEFSVLFPTDMRYGWNLGLKEHQDIITRFQKAIRIQVKLYTPECTPWSQASQTADPERKAANRSADLPALQWVSDECKNTNLDGTDYVIENPAKSAIWEESPLKELQSDERMYNNTCDQCQHGAQDAEGTPIQKRTKFMASLRMRRTAIQCQCVRPHAWLVGGAQTSKAKIFPEKLCKNILKDIGKRIEMTLKTPLDLLFWTCESISSKSPKKEIVIKPNFDLQRFKHQLEEAASDQARLALLLGFHLKFWHATPDEMARLLAALGVEPNIIKLCPQVVKDLCEGCRKYAMPLHRPAFRAHITTKFNERVQGDLFFLWDMIWLILVDEHIRYKVIGVMKDKTAPEYLRCMGECWIRFFGPMETFVSDQEGALTSDLVGTTLDRYTIKREFAGTDTNKEEKSTTGLVESHIRMTKSIALKNEVVAKREGLNISKETLMYEAAMSQNLLLNFGGSTPANALLGYTPRDFYDENSATTMAHKGALEISPDTFESNVRMRLLSKQNVLKTIVEERLAIANKSRPQKLDIERIKVGDKVDLYRTPSKKDQEGWRGPCDLLHMKSTGAIVVWNGYPYIVPLRHIRIHQRLEAWTNSYERQHTASPPSMYLVTDYTDMLDIVEGTVPFKPQIVGMLIGADGKMRASSSMGETPPKVWSLAQQCAEDEWGIKIDGIVFGRCVRRLYAVTGTTFGRQVTWDCTRRDQYVTTDINPSRQVLDIINAIPNMSDVNACSILFYSFSSMTEDEETKKYVIPDFSDISAIDPDDESMLQRQYSILDMDILKQQKYILDLDLLLHQLLQQLESDFDPNTINYHFQQDCHTAEEHLRDHHLLLNERWQQLQALDESQQSIEVDDKSMISDEQFVPESDRHLVSAYMDSDELDEYQTIMTSMAQEVSDNLQCMSDNELTWTAEEAHWTIPGPFKESRTFYFDLNTGNAIFAQNDDILTEEDIIKYWPLVEAADRLESRSFIDNLCFKAVHHNNMDSSNVIDAVWVRRWKKDGNIMMVWTVHVDDIIVLAKQAWLLWGLNSMEKRFGKIKRHELPFTHMGMSYEVLGERHLFIHQHVFTEGLKKIEIPFKLKDKLDHECDAKLTHDLRSVLCSLLWLCQTREDIYCDVVQLQQIVKKSNIGHLKQANLIVDRAKRNMKMAGLHFAPLSYPVRLVSVGDAGHGNTKTSYPQEGSAVFLMEDHMYQVRIDKKDLVDPSDNYLLGGSTHPLMISSGKSKRISHSTCNAETNAGYKVNQAAQFIALRMSEIIMCSETQHKAKDMMEIFDRSLYQVRIDHCTDCMDFWQLCCGVKGVPSDKSSRLAVLSMREERLSGRIRNFIHLPTEVVIVDGLTKTGTFKLLMEHLTTGRWYVRPPKGKYITIRRIIHQQDSYSEQDLLDLNE